MHEELKKIPQSPMDIRGEGAHEMTLLYPGIGLSYLSFGDKAFPIHHSHGAMGHVMQINHCRSGQMRWEMNNGNEVYLNPGDLFLHTMDVCTDSVVSFPTGHYSGLTVYIDLQEAAACPPEWLEEMNPFRSILREKFCPDNSVSFIAGNEQTGSIFSGLYDQPEPWRLPCQKLKTAELLLYLLRLELTPKARVISYPPEQIEIVRRVHDALTEHMDQRLTIEMLAKQYLINATTLKAAFKSVYGNSIAAHIKEHRMEHAAVLLRTTDMTIAQIAQTVGYDSQSKFTQAFKSVHHVLPREYRKRSEM